MDLKYKDYIFRFSQMDQKL